MAKLILSMDGLVLKEIPLSKERTTSGRKAHNDIQIDNLAVSGEHAVIVTILNDSFMEDLGSTNGTLVNGNPVKKHILQSNDVIEIGKYKLKYVSEQAAGQDEGDPSGKRGERQRLGVPGHGFAFEIGSAQDGGADAVDEPHRQRDQSELDVEQRVGERLGRIGDKQQGPGDGVHGERKPQ